MIARWWIALAVAGCGDGVLREEVFEPASGTRLKLEWHQYADGTRQVEPGAFYDTRLHERCTPQRWIDGVTRCVPVVEQAVYADATCETAVGRTPSTDEPRHFIAYDSIAGAQIPARLLVPGAAIEPIAQSFTRQDGACTGPVPSPIEPLIYYAIADEVPGYDQVELREGERGDGRLAMRTRETDDGLRVPVGLVDRELAAACATAAHPELGLVCEPAGAVPSVYFGDPDCLGRVITLDDATPIPVSATVPGPSGCVQHHRVGAAVEPVLYRRDGERCDRVALDPEAPLPRTFAVGDPLELPILDHVVEEEPERRLQRVVLDLGSLPVVDDRLFDTATRADCRRTALGDQTRCLPVTLASSTTLFGADCAVAVRVSQLPERTCGRVAFATVATEAGVELRAVGDRVVEPLFHLPNGACQLYPVAANTVLRALGPPIAPETFVEALTFGER